MAHAFSYGICAFDYDFFTWVGIQFRQDSQDKKDYWRFGIFLLSALLFAQTQEESFPGIKTSMLL